jgi:effector-binding domain-containing protein
VTVYHGAMSGIGDAWTAFMHWVEQQGYALPPVCREVYLTGPGVPEEDWDTELIQPVTAK